MTQQRHELAIHYLFAQPRSIVPRSHTCKGCQHSKGREITDKIGSFSNSIRNIGTPNVKDLCEAQNVTAMTSRGENLSYQLQSQKILSERKRGICSIYTYILYLGNTTINERNLQIFKLISPNTSLLVCRRMP